MNINLHIERLIVTDMQLDARGKVQLGRAIQQRLLAELNERGLVADIAGLAGQRSVQGGSLSYTDSDRPDTIGGRIGSAIFRGIGNDD